MAERAHPDDPAFRGTVYEERLRERYAFCLPFVQQRDVLDVPCGTGWGSSLLSGYASLTGLDIDPGAIDYARAHYPGIRFVEGAMQNLPFDDHQFDMLICLEGLEHVALSDAQRFLREAHRVLRPGGTIIVTAPLLRDGKHSLNPHHLYEFDTDELRTLLARYFDPLLWETFQGGDGPEARFVGRRRQRLYDEEVTRVTSTMMFDRVYDWTLSLSGEHGARFTAGGEETLIATSCAVLILEGIDRLQDVPSSLRDRWVEYLQGCQRTDDGLFTDPLLERFPVAGNAHDLEYLLDQTTYFALQALDALGSAPRHPIRVLERWPTPEVFVAWMERLDWSNAWLQSNRVMFALAFLVYAVEHGQEAEAAQLVHAALDWLDAMQDQETGTWGRKDGSSLLNSMAATYHFLPFYEHLQRPIQRLNHLVDATLALQQPDGLFGAEPGGGACEDLDAIGVLAIAARYSDYRADEVKRSVLRAFWGLWNTQNDDGGFGYALRDDDQTYRFSNWAAMESHLRASDVWATWSRLVTVGTIRHWFAADVPPLPPWRFRRYPGLGYHRITNALDDAECERLTAWLRPLPASPAPSETTLCASVVVPCYNLGRYLREALASALGQTLQPVEVIVVDDGSTDDYTRLVLDTLDHPQVRVIRQENRGLPVARNRGIRDARAPFICCLDADDRLHPEFFARALPLLEAHPETGFVTTYYREFDGRSGLVAYPTCTLPEMLVINHAMVSSLFRREAWERAGGYCETLSGMQDWDLWIGILEAGYRAEVIPEVLFDYRVRPGSMYATTSRPDHYARLVGQLIERHMDLYQRWWREVIVLYAEDHARVVAYAAGQTLLARQARVSGDPANNALRQEVDAWRTMAEERAVWIAELAAARDYHAQQAANWQAVAEQYAAARDYHAQQAANWQAVAEEFAAARDYHAQQAANWQAVAERQERDYLQVPRSRAALRRLVRRKAARRL